MQTVSPHTLGSQLQSTTEQFALIDVRSREEYDALHIKESVNIPLDILSDHIVDFNREKDIIFICRSGARSAHATLVSLEEGIHGYNLVGGMVEFSRLYPELCITTG